MDKLVYPCFNKTKGVGTDKHSLSMPPPSSLNVGPSSVSQTAASGCREDIPPTSWIDTQGSRLTISSCFLKRVKTLDSALNRDIVVNDAITMSAFEMDLIYMGLRVILSSTESALNMKKSTAIGKLVESYLKKEEILIEDEERH